MQTQPMCMVRVSLFCYSWHHLKLMLAILHEAINSRSIRNDIRARSYLESEARTVKHKTGILLSPLFADLSIAAGTYLW